MSFFVLSIVVLVVVPYAFYFLRSTREVKGPLTKGQARVRVLSLVVLCFFIAGIGICGGFGTVAGLMTLLDANAGSEGRAFAPLFLVPGLVGLLIAVGGGLAIHKNRRQDG